jgi:hypothetical protein
MADARRALNRKGTFNPCPPCVLHHTQPSTTLSHTATSGFSTRPDTSPRPQACSFTSAIHTRTIASSFGPGSLSTFDQRLADRARIRAAPPPPPPPPSQSRKAYHQEHCCNVTVPFHGLRHFHQAPASSVLRSAGDVRCQPKTPAPQSEEQERPSPVRQAASGILSERASKPIHGADPSLSTFNLLNGLSPTLLPAVDTRK